MGETGAKYGLTPSEGIIQKQVVAYLRLRGFLVFEFAKGGTHRALRGSVPDGWPDVLAIKPPIGEHWYIEVKAASGRVTQVQRDMHEALRHCGCHVWVVRSLEDVQEIMGHEDNR